MYIATVSFPGCEVIIFKIKLVFLIMPFFGMSEKSRQILRYLENDESF